MRMSRWRAVAGRLFKWTLYQLRRRSPQSSQAGQFGLLTPRLRRSSSPGEVASALFCSTVSGGRRCPDRDAHLVAGVPEDLCRRVGVVRSYVGQQDMLACTNRTGERDAIRMTAEHDDLLGDEPQSGRHDDAWR